METKKRLIHYGFGEDDVLRQKIDYCLSNDYVLVFITPAVKTFHPNVLYGIEKLKKFFWIYELNMAMKTVMKKRAWDYFCNYQNSFFEIPQPDVVTYNSSDLFCCYVETNPKLIEKPLRQSASRFNVNLTAIGKGEKWEGFTTKLKLYKEYLQTRTEKFVLGMDSRDTLYINNADEILDRFIKLYYCRGHKIVFNSETNCYPNKELADKHPCQSKKYKYLNSGCFIGEREYFIDLLNECETYAKKKKVINKNDDQELIQHIFLDKINKQDHSIWLDYDCNIFQVLWDEHGGRSANFDMVYQKDCCYNLNTKTFPCIIHYPGPTGHANTVLKNLDIT